MSERIARPIPNLVFRLMCVYLGLRDRFTRPEKILAKAGIRRGQRILDFGCGGGSYAIPAAKMVGEEGKVYALDIHPLSQEYVVRKAAKEGLTNISTILSDRDTHLPDQSVDVVLLYDIIHMIQDKPALLEELHRVLKPEGALSVLAMHFQVSNVLNAAEGLFSLTYRDGNLLNFTKQSGLG